MNIENISVSYGRIRALEDVSLHIEAGEIVSLLGANGAGKTTLLKAVSGLVPVKTGSISFRGQNLLKLKSHRIARCGVAHSPEGRRIFPGLTVMENLRMGALPLKDRKREKEAAERAFEYFPRLADRKHQRGGTLSGGEQQMLALARALMSFPELLMLDEPSLGLAPQIIDMIFDMIVRISRDENLTVFLVEQNANEALLHSSRAYILENGRISMEGPSEQLRKDPRVIEAYLGA